MTWSTVGSTSRALLLAAALLPDAKPLAAGQGAELPQASWVTLLKIQLKEGYNCTLGEMLYWRDVPVGADIGTEGRVRCLDRREYQFTRSRENERFSIRLCQPTVC